MDGATYTADRQTKTYVPKYLSIFLLAGLWTRPALILTIILILLASISKLGNDASKLLTVFISLKMGV